MIDQDHKESQNHVDTLQCYHLLLKELRILIEMSKLCKKFDIEEEIEHEWCTGFN